MRTKSSFRPKLEVLEDRWVPATIQLTSGILVVSHQVGPLTVAPTTTPGQVAVTDNTGTRTVSGVGTLIEILGTNAADTITFTGNTGFNGNLIIDGGNGDDTITLGAAAVAASIDLAAGNDTLTLGNFANAATIANVETIAGAAGNSMARAWPCHESSGDGLLSSWRKRTL